MGGGVLLPACPWMGRGIIIDAVCDDVIHWLTIKTGATLIFIFSGALLLLQCCHVSSVTIATWHLDTHLRSAALSQPRSTSQNKLQTRQYIHDFWNALTNTASVQLIEQKDDDSTAINMVLVVRGTAWGTAADRPAVLCAHYDSQPTTPGNNTVIYINTAWCTAWGTISFLCSVFDFSMIFWIFLSSIWPKIKVVSWT